mgnify:FL=1
MFNKRIFVTAAFLLTAVFVVPAQEALKSTEEEYYDFLALEGIVQRPTLGYRTLSDSVWTIPEDAEGNIWSGNNLGSTKDITGHISYKLFGPDWYNSFNTAAPYGQNDGALWQGKGYNSSLTAGARLEAYGFEVTLKPQLSFSQNLDFDYITPNSAYTGNSLYSGKAGTYGYYGVPHVDAPQRFGDSPFFTFDWGDTEIRYTWKTLTAGFGTQAVWLGPAQLNPIMSSNNAASYPKVDIGLRRTSVYMPWLGWYLGDIEFRGWWGYLSESDYFDTDDTDDHNLFTGYSLSWAVPHLKGLTFGLNRTMLSKWNNFSSYTLFGIYDAFNLTSGGSDASDQRISFTADWLFPKIGLDIYTELARNDFSPNFDYLFRYPFHTLGWSAGLQKTTDFTETIKGKILLEVTFLECSADYDRLINWYSTFYAHNVITQGYTNEGQWLGAGIGTGGNSQYLGYELYFPKGSGKIFVQRRNPDLDYTMYIDSRKYAENYENKIWSAEGNIRAIFDIGIGGSYWVLPSLQITGTFIFEDEHNPLNVSENQGNGAQSIHRYNCIVQISGKYNF